MAFTVEDGTGLPDSNAYIDVAFADDYFALRGNTDWFALDDDAKQYAIVNATDYIDLRWGKYLKGMILVETQALMFPRNLWDGIPNNLKKATAEYALRASSDTLWSDPDYDSSGYAVSEKSEKVGPIEETVKYATSESDPFGTARRFRSYPIPDGMMQMFLSSINQGRVVRA